MEHVLNSKIFDDPQCNLIDSGLIDSYAIVDIVSECEEKFDIEFDAGDITHENFATPETIWALIEKYQEK